MSRAQLQTDIAALSRKLRSLHRDSRDEFSREAAKSLGEARLWLHKDLGRAEEALARARTLSRYIF